MPPDLEFKIDDRMGILKPASTSPKPLSMTVTSVERPGLNSPASAPAKNGGKLFDFSGHKIGGILGDVRNPGENYRQRLTDIAHVIFRQYRLAVWLILLDPAVAKADWWNIENIRRGPNRHDTRMRQSVAAIDRQDLAMCARRANDPHVQLVRKVDVSRKPPPAQHQWPIFEPRATAPASRTAVVDRHRCLAPRDGGAFITIDSRIIATLREAIVLAVPLPDDIPHRSEAFPAGLPVATFAPQRVRHPRSSRRLFKHFVGEQQEICRAHWDRAFRSARLARTFL